MATSGLLVTDTGPGPICIKIIPPPPLSIFSILDGRLAMATEPKVVPAAERRIHPAATDVVRTSAG
jgi:hypothetical protein